MSHNTCIAELARRGASTDTIRMVAAFLNKRTMRLKVNNTYSEPRAVKGGSPQGTKIGNFLFTVTIEAIEEVNHNILRQLPPSIEDLNSRPTRFATKPIDRFNSGEFTSRSTPIKAGTSDGVLRYIDESGRGLSDSSLEVIQMEPEETIDPWTLKYVDDLNVGEQIQIDGGEKHISTGREKRKVRAGQCEEVFRVVQENAAQIGMKVNHGKTQLICISGHSFLDINSYVEIGGEVIAGRNELKVLGFVFGRKVGIEAHVRHIIKKFGTKAWAI